jgi:hypothetical protein
MVKKHSEKPPLTLVGLDTTIGKPPRTLGRHGRSLWDRIQSEYDVSDMLAQACAALDLAEQLHTEVERDGAVIRIGGVIKAHPAIKDAIAARSFVVRTLVKLGLNFEPVRQSVGRPT